MVYSRRESTTQTPEIALLQEAKGEVWGGVPRGGNWATVQAYVGPLSNNSRGIEFTTEIPPADNGSSPFEVRWYYPNTHGVQVRYNESREEMACITARVTNLQK